MKTITTRDFAAVKRVAQNVNSDITRRNKIISEIERLQKELEETNIRIEAHETGIKALTGFTSGDLVIKVVENTGKTDKEGRPIKITKYEPRPDFVIYNEETKLYEIHLPVEEKIKENTETIETNITEEC